MHDHSPGKIHQGHACCVVCVSAVWSDVLSPFARAVWSGAMVLYARWCLRCCLKCRKWVSGCVVLEAIRVVHVIIYQCVVQRGVAVE